jgi:predicted ATPase
MVYLEKFKLMDEAENYSIVNRVYADEEDKFGLPTQEGYCVLLNDLTPDEHYPIGLFNLKLSKLDFNDITILYGGNGSGKTTLLNIIAEELSVGRIKKYLRTRLFDFYLKKCYYQLAKKENVPFDSIDSTTLQYATTRLLNELYNPDGRIQRIPPKSKFLCSDDIFSHILSVREQNKELEDKKEHIYDDIYMPQSINCDDPKDLEMLRLAIDARKTSKKQFIRKRVGEMQRQYSNGENALMFFDKQIEENALYLLDEPENSMSPKFQLELKALIEDSVRYKNCQFIIATHSPFLLALKDAKIYNLDASPVTVEKWQELENVRFFYDFFKTHEDLFSII